MAGWTWDLVCKEGGCYADLEHDGRVHLTIGSTIGNARTAIVDSVDFEAMCRSFLDRAEAWRARAAGGA